MPVSCGVLLILSREITSQRRRCKYCDVLSEEKVPKSKNCIHIYCQIKEKPVSFQEKKIYKQ